MWVEDREALRCHSCNRPFTLLLRRHHCRHCGQVFCHACTRNRLINVGGVEDNQLHRLCDECFDGLEEQRDWVRLLPLQEGGCFGPGWRKLGAVTNRSGSPILLNQQTQCPVCNAQVPMRFAERHLRKCLEGHGKVIGKWKHSLPNLGNRYTITKEVAGRECDICYEEMERGDSIALLNCLCQFHQRCIDQWFARGHACPFHPE